MAKIKVMDIESNTAFSIVLGDSLQAGMVFSTGDMIIELKVGGSKIITNKIDATAHNMGSWDELETRVFENLNTTIVFNKGAMFVKPQLLTQKEIYAMLKEYEEDDDRTK